MKFSDFKSFLNPRENLENISQWVFYEVIR